MDRTRERKRIAKDPFHEKILEALAGPFDPQVFEACMGDLLQDDFPGLVPVPGGNDAGMDGAIASGKGEPFPLVCTIEENVYGNLGQSLDSYLERGLSSRLVALATSRALTPPQTRNLFRLAREKGFTLLQVFERSAVAGRLYRNSVWCKRLLNLTGAPSALSVIPLSRRPFVDVDLAGREADAEWLRSTSGDRVIVGEPGSGKTYLFSRLISEGWPALFLVGEDETEIANALRDQKPEIVIVDDAHVAPDWLVRLRRLRQVIVGSFDIVASTWPGAREAVQEALGCPDSHLHKLELLPRSQILEIIRGVGVEASEGVLRSLVDQSANKPGLAVTIARLWLQGEWQKILDGTVLSRTILALFRDLVGEEAIEVLAAFSLGGSVGVSPAVVSKFLQLRPGEVDRITAGLAAGGVLSEAGLSWLVRPEPLRSALLREVFFSGRPTAHDSRKLLQSVPDYDKAVEAVLSARLYGGTIESSKLREMVSRSKGERPWKGLAYVSPEDARWVMEAYRGEILNLAEALLHQIPEEVIPQILERAADFLRTGDFRPERAMSVLSSWVQDINAGPAEWIRRRRMVARAARQFLLSGGDRSIGVNAICIALSPAVRGSVLDPAMGNTVIMRSGLLPVESLQKIAQIWDEAGDAIQEIDLPSWQHLSSALWDWLYPEHAARRSEVSDEERRATRALAERMLKDLAKRSGGSPGLRAGLSRLAAKIGLDLGTGQDEVFDLIYPARDSSAEEYRSSQVQRNEDVRRLAAEWARESPEQVAARIAFYEQEAQRINYGWMQNMPGLCQALAESVDEPERWLDALLRSNLRGHLISPFLGRIVKLRREGWEQTVQDCLETEALAWTAASLILTLPDPSPALLNRVFGKLGELTPLVEGLCLRKEVPLATLRSLLNFPAWETALAAAVGEWCSDPEGEVRAEIYPEWRAAVLRAKTEDYEGAEHKVGLQYWLGPILASDPDLALEWLRSRLRDPDLPWHFMGDSPFSIAAYALRRQQKEELLAGLAPAEILQSLVPALIGRDVDLYKRLLSLSDLKDYHLAPIGGPQAHGWEDFVLAALDAGCLPEAIAQASFGTSHSWVGSGIEYWERWDQAFATFERHPRAEFQDVVRSAREWVRAKLTEARRLQQHYELHGLGREG
jgi:hypothetical protein